ncbi:uncharacterized protein BDR25DRAFT_355282 [Lindgomyces ingoldianus]|uniref:Uncharacterized protein n=1 Tax=Lindgomyces ingoldianus TaxID=673940 RepID=A0ACB6QWB3_9PLEO|nr:uncharacterized protein BDR25DRAFT_355282 [Lindgomyces ingoldianus]KAF2470800.1 hypothetical protein BDR25DRAFT_355282 [Lindgomyces ingoldianus]
MGMISQHKGVSNRILRELGWVVVVRGNQDSPQNSELSLRGRADSKIYEMISVTWNTSKLYPKGLARGI